MRRRQVQVSPPKSGFAGFRFPPEVILVAIRWYLRYGLSYRDVEELLAERGITVDHVTLPDPAGTRSAIAGWSTRRM
jgi:transposase, IS6 family